MPNTLHPHCKEVVTDVSDWHLRNNQFLGAALRWLRLRLGALAASAGDDVEDSGQLNSAAQNFSWREKIEQAEMEMDAAASGEMPPALILLSYKLGLSDFEQWVLLLCVAMEFDTSIAHLCADAQDHPNRPYPTFALALACFDDPEWGVVLPERPLRFWRLIEIHTVGNQPLITSALRADERIVNYLKGLNYLDDRLESLVFPFNPGEKMVKEGILPLPASGREVAEAMALQIKTAVAEQDFPLWKLTGIDNQSKCSIIWKVCQELNLRLYRLPLELLPTQGTELETLARLWERESLLLPLALYVDVQGWDEAANARGMALLRRFLSRSQGIFFLDVRESGLALERRTVTFDVAKPTPVEQRAAWELVLGMTSPPAPLLGGEGRNITPPFPAREGGLGGLGQPKAKTISEQLANQFNLNLVEIGQIAEKARGEVGEEPELQARLWQGCLASTRPRLDSLAQRLEVKATWDDIVLPDEEKKLLEQIADQVRNRGVVYDEWGFRERMNRGLGVSALFAGESGTGKTMAAEVIANVLQLNLYRIDLSAVVSKYIGETEKNLRRLFDAAEDGGAILFFDEADALFGKRGEVKDSHDRYANIEINYLLQRLEAYRGLAILATNIKSAMDVAFVRRLRFMVDFPFPGVKERKQMWEKVFPPQTPTEELDLQRLAQFNVTGANIHNIALNAAFLAAKAGTPVGMELVLAAARTEFRKLGRQINEADFRVSGGR
ncbi:AAA ATPase central domain protein [Crinalium epipsammum PCC 9333]|uniref:AAA ATPase central domain protein n=1 Tax=Crinalium epipsammum PCC 9333 TaxID=1173022 RepID=K9VVD3_9CYAN|nr:ATP-binding protein [Crinalium epipsammum]AFZ12043.1 AAA ATPase central domain protein [Crinalium epipsammum PCC 9333]